MDEQNIPIDITTTKILDWLISRRHVSKDWQKDVLKVREKINSAIQDMPEHEGIVRLLSGQHINYFHCLKIVEILKQTEADTKNIFGRYGSQRMKDWQDIVSSYQKDNIYLAETAQILIRNVNYEIPGLRKQAAKLEQNILDCDKKIKEYGKTENNALKEYKALCEELCIEGRDIKKELIKLVDELPEILDRSAERIKLVDPVIDFYTAFLQFNFREAVEAVPTLKYLVEKGNTSTYEYVYGEKPLKIETPQLQLDSEDDKASNDEIDFGDLITMSKQVDNDNIILDDEGDFSEQIDFGMDIEPAKETESSSSNNESFEILTKEEFENLGEGVSDLEESAVMVENCGIVIEESGCDGGIARGEEALSILDNPKINQKVVNDLLELEAFLKMRIHEMSGEDNFVTTIVMQKAPTIIQNQSIEIISKYVEYVATALSDLTNKRVQYLHNIKHSPKYVDILTSSLKQKLAVVDRMNENKKVQQEKIEALQKEARDLKPVISLLIDKSKELQKDLESEISKKYKGRTVNIVGGINML